MKYILKYKIKSRYFGFVREYLKEFESKYSVFNFIVNNPILEWQLYEKIKEHLLINDLIKGGDSNE